MKLSMNLNRTHRRRSGGLLIAAAGVATLGAASLPVAGRTDTTTIARQDSAVFALHAVLAERKLYEMRGTDTVKVYDVAVGQPEYPTPVGAYTVRHIIWNPGWTPPPDAEWARGQQPREPGDPRNPMKTAKIFFHDPDYYIHGTGDVESMGEAASHGCLRMRPADVAQLASEVMTAGGVKHDWSWVKRTLRIGSTREVYLSRPVTLTVEEGVAPLDSITTTAADTGTQH